MPGWKVKITSVSLFLALIVLYAAAGSETSNYSGVPVSEPSTTLEAPSTTETTTTTELQATTSTTTTTETATTSTIPTETTQTTLTTEQTTSTTEQTTSTTETTTTTIESTSTTSTTIEQTSTTTESTSTTTLPDILLSSDKIDDEIKALLRGEKEIQVQALKADVAKLKNRPATIPVIIKLRDESNFNSRLAGIESTTASRQDKIKLKQNLMSESYGRVQRKVLEDLNASETSKDDFTIRHRYQLSNAFSAEVTPSALEKIVKNPNVLKIQYNREFEIQLSESVPLINATRAWNTYYLGRNFTGKGETVCIVDTGINYGHQDLGNCRKLFSPQTGNVVDCALESPHPYSSSTTYTWNITRPGFTSIAVHFDNISLEECPNEPCDHIYVVYPNGSIAQNLNGHYTDFWSVSIPGDTVNITLVTDPSVTDWGFRIDKVLNGTTVWNCSKFVGGYDFIRGDDDPWDDHGHGTHCAGIVAARGSVMGVAPDAKLTSAKVCNITGSCPEDAINAGLEWCVLHAAEFNISVISMSIGGGLYSTYCDSADSTTTDLVNTAVGDGIIVTIASGNGGSSSSIAWPACIANATSVGSVSKSDVIASDSNSGSILDLLAPGVSIYSTYLPPNNYTSMSGTSMATPHVAGAAAILQQWSKDRTGQALAPAQIESLLKDSGKRILDSRNGLNFSRIDVYAAMLNMTNTAPKLGGLAVTPSSAVNGTVFYFNVTYTDAENNTADFVNITLDGVTYAMSEANPLDRNMMDGKLYYYNKTINSVGNYSFNVTASDGLRLNFSGTVNQPTTNYTCSSTPSLSSANVVSWIDNIRAIFNFTVSFTDYCNLSAMYVNFTLDGAIYRMNETNQSDATTSDGKKYYRELNITSGGLKRTSFNAANSIGSTASQLSYLGPAVKGTASCTGTSPPASDFWSILLNTNCSNTQFIASNNGGVNITAGNTLRLSNSTVFIRNTLLRMEDNTNLVLSNSEIAFIDPPENFTIVVLPDTQKYSESYPQIFTNQTQWIVSQIQAKNIVFVAHEGDIVDDEANETQWQNANASMSLLDNQVPYGVLPGNHDGASPSTTYNTYFHPSRYSSYPWYGGNYSGNRYNYELFSAGGQDYIIFHLAYCPSTNGINWANQTLLNYSGRKAIIVTHGFLNENAEREAHGCGSTQYIWDGLIAPNQNVFLVMNGHDHGEARRNDTANGRVVHQLLADYQSLSNGGNGWLRILEFSPIEKKLYVKTYSPYLDQYNTSSSSQFTLDI